MKAFRVTFCQPKVMLCVIGRHTPSTNSSVSTIPRFCAVGSIQKALVTENTNTHPWVRLLVAKPTMRWATSALYRRKTRTRTVHPDARLPNTTLCSINRADARACGTAKRGKEDKVCRRWYAKTAPPWAAILQNGRCDGTAPLIRIGKASGGNHS